MKTNKLKLVVLASVLLLVSTAGVILFMRSHAATPNISAEPENGTLTGNARLTTDASASNGSALAFGKMVTVDQFPTDGTGWSAHRGGGQAPYMWFDGTMTAYRNAYAAGATLIDLDMQATKDNILVAMHDSTVDRTTAGTGPVSSFNYDDLPLVDMRYASGDGWPPEKIPKINDILDELGGKVLLTIEAKDASDIAPLAKLIKSKGLQNSMFINVNHGRNADIRAIVAAGIKAHAWGLSSVADVQDANSDGAFLVELPYNASSTVVSACNNATKIKRCVAGPIEKLNQRAKMNPGLDGFVSDSPLYLDRKPLDLPTEYNISKETSSHKIGPGWQTIYPSSVSHSLPLFNSKGLVLNQGANYRRLSLGSLNGTRPAIGSMTFKFILAANSDTNERSDFRIMVPREQGDGTNATSNGYTIGLRKNGSLVMWSAPATGFGTQIDLGSVQTAAPGDTEENTIRFEWTSTTITLSRLDSSGNTLGVLGPITNKDWRGPDVMVSGTGPTVLTSLEIR